MNEYHKIQTVFLRPGTSRPCWKANGPSQSLNILPIASGLYRKWDGTNIRVRFDANTSIGFRGQTITKCHRSCQEAARDVPTLESQFADMFPTGVCLYN